MAILGYNTKGSTPQAFAGGRMYVTKFTLASAMTMTELHCWAGQNGPGPFTATFRIVLYAADGSSGDPGTRLAYTSPFSTPSVDTDLSQTGFSVSLAAADYWIGWVAQNVAGGEQSYGETSGATSKRKSSGALDPPDNPFGTVSLTTAVKLSAWAVVGASSSTWNGSSTVSLTDTVTTAGNRLGVTSHGATTTTETVAITAVSRAVTLHASTAVSETVTVTTAGVRRLPQMTLVPRSPGSLTLTAASPSSLVLVPRPPDSLVLTPR